VGVSEDSGDILGEACWDQLLSLHALKFVDIMGSGALSRRMDYLMSALNVGKGLERRHFTIRGDSLSLSLSMQTGFL